MWDGAPPDRFIEIQDSDSTGGRRRWRKKNGDLKERMGDMHKPKVDCKLRSAESKAFRRKKEGWYERNSQGI